MVNLSNLSFNVRGSYFPSDHNYGLYASLINFNSNLRQLKWQLGTIKGIPDHNGLIELGSESKLSIRCDPNDIKQFLGLKSLSVGKWSIELDNPLISDVIPKTRLFSRIVVIKNAEERGAFVRSLTNQFNELGLEDLNFAVYERKTIKIKRFTVVGYSVNVSCANHKESEILIYHGVGGKRRMGCGVFW